MVSSKKSHIKDVFSEPSERNGWDTLRNTRQESLRSIYQSVWKSTSTGWRGLQKDKPHTHWTWSLGGNIIKKANRHSQTAPRTIWATQCDTVEVQEKGQEEQGRQIKHQGWERICTADVNISPSSYWCKMDSTFPLLIITLACSPLGTYSFESAGQSSCVSSSSKFILWAESIDFITLPFPRLSLMKRGSE